MSRRSHLRTYEHDTHTPQCARDNCHYNHWFYSCFLDHHGSWQSSVMLQWSVYFIVRDSLKNTHHGAATLVPSVMKPTGALCDETDNT